MSNWLAKVRADGLEAEHEELLDCVTRARGNLARAAELLTALRRKRLGVDANAVTRTSVYRLLEKHGLKPPVVSRGRERKVK